MSKKDKKEEKKEARVIGISKRGKKLIFIGIGVLIVGFLVLTRTDPAGQNWASHLSPFLIIGGYAIIGIGIIFPDPKPQDKPPVVDIK